MDRRVVVKVALTGLTALAGLALPQLAHAGIPVTMALSDGDDEVEILGGVVTIDGIEVLDFADFDDGYDWDVTIEGGDGNDHITIDDIPDWINFEVQGGDDEDSIVNYDESRTIVADGGAGVDACAENLSSSSNCETDVDLVAIGLRWDYDQNNNELTLRGTSGADQIAVFNLFSVGFYLFNGHATGLGGVLWDYGDGHGGNPVDSLVIYGQRGADEIWVAPGSHAEQVTIYGGRGADHIITMGTIPSGSSVLVDAGGNTSDTCYRGENDVTSGSYSTLDCEQSGYRDWSDFEVVD